MLTFLLAIIYLAFISLGLPDSLLGTAWPQMRLGLGMPLSAAGAISMLITGGTIVSSLFSSKLIKRFGTGKVTFISVFMTAVSLFGFSVSGSFWMFCLLAIPLGLGAGAVDSGLNNFVALHYQAQHMSWLHCFWGIGATSGPLIMSIFLLSENGWRSGYAVIAGVQIVLTLALGLSLPLWKRVETSGQDDELAETPTTGKGGIFAMPVVRMALASFFCYCAIELTVGLWGSSYLVNAKGISADLAARWVSLFYLGMTIGRLLTGFLAMKLTGRSLIRLGELSLVLGVVLFLLPVNAGICAAGFVMMGLGCAPIFPCMLHDTPNKVGKELSQSMMGVQMAFAYIGNTVMPPVFGLLAGKIGVGILPIYILALLVVLCACTERANLLISVKRSI